MSSNPTHVLQPPAPVLVLRAPAKLNLTLEILGKRPDGYHEISSVMQAISLHDTLKLERLDRPSIELVGAPPGLAGSDNLVVRSAHLLRDEAARARPPRPCAAGARIQLRKRIPVAAGLGGGSSDAAATLRALNLLWDLRLPPSMLAALAARLGSDVPFFLDGPTALAGGRGEQLTPLPSPPPAWVVLLRPPVEVSTREVYSWVAPADYTDGTRSRALARHIRERPDWGQRLFNALERVTCELCPTAAEARAALHAAGAKYPVMSGSGPTFFGVMEHEAEARAVRDRLTRQGYEAYVASFSNPQSPISARIAGARPAAS